MNDVLLTGANAPGLTSDDQNLHGERIKLWNDFNHAWLAMFQRQKEMMESGEQVQRPQSLISKDGLQRMGKELIRLCDSIERHGLVDYQYGVWEEQIIDSTYFPAGRRANQLLGERACVFADGWGLAVSLGGVPRSLRVIQHDQWRRRWRRQLASALKSLGNISTCCLPTWLFTWAIFWGLLLFWIEVLCTNNLFSLLFFFFFFASHIHLLIYFFPSDFFVPFPVADSWQRHPKVLRDLAGSWKITLVGPGTYLGVGWVMQDHARCTSRGYRMYFLFPCWTVLPERGVSCLGLGRMRKKEGIECVGLRCPDERSRRHSVEASGLSRTAGDSVQLAFFFLGVLGVFCLVSRR